MIHAEPFHHTGEAASAMSAEQIIRLFLSDDETIARYIVAGEYISGYCIVPSDEDLMQIDLAGCLEDTLHRLLEKKGEHPELASLSPNDVVRMVMLASQDDDENEEDPEYRVYIDLGYRIHGPLLDVDKVGSH